MILPATVFLSWLQGFVSPSVQAALDAAAFDVMRDKIRMVRETPSSLQRDFKRLRDRIEDIDRYDRKSTLFTTKLAALERDLKNSMPPPAHRSPAGYGVAAGA